MSTKNTQEKKRFIFVSAEGSPVKKGSIQVQENALKNSHGDIESFFKRRKRRTREDRTREVSPRKSALTIAHLYPLQSAADVRTDPKATITDNYRSEKRADDASHDYLNNFNVRTHKRTPPFAQGQASSKSRNPDIPTFMRRKRKQTNGSNRY